MKRQLLAACALLLIHAAVGAAELRSFGRGEMARILDARQGRAFVLTLWSTECAHCKDTLRQLSALAQGRAGIDLVVVNTDNVGAKQTIATMLAATGLSERDTWVFGDEAPERLRFEIDRRWGGEMPRTYLFDRDHKTSAYSGPLGAAVLQDWLARNAAGEAAHKTP